MTKRGVHSTALAALLLSACSYNPPPVPVVGDPADIARLEGEWVGEYEYPENGRRGNLVFRLTAGASTAFGDVQMFTRPTCNNALPLDALPAAPEQTFRVLSIRFVRAAAGEVVGTMVPYEDDVCHCTVHTTFNGRIRGERVQGTFAARQEPGGTVRTGSWYAVRRPDPEIVTLELRK